LLAAVLAQSDPLPMGWIRRPKSDEIPRLVGAITGAGWNRVGVIVLALALAGAGVALYQAVRAPARTAAGLALAGWLLLPLGLSLLISLTVVPILYTRYLAVSIPAAAFAIAVLVAAARPVLFRALHIALVLLVPLLMLDGAIRTARTGRPTQDFSTAIHTVLDQYQPGDGLLVIPGHYRIPVDWYLQKESASRYRDLATVFPRVPAGDYSGTHVLDQDRPFRPPPTSPHRIWVIALPYIQSPWFAAMPVSHWLTRQYPSVESTRIPGLVLQLYSR
jgi:hypothetical protein